MEPMADQEHAMLATLLKHRASLTNDLKAFQFIETNTSATTPFSGVFVPQATAPVYPIKGRFFLKQEADTVKGSIGGTDKTKGPDCQGCITSEQNKKTGKWTFSFDMRIYWANQDYTTLGVKKGQDGEADQQRQGSLLGGDTLRFPFYHSTYNSTADTHEHSSQTRESLTKLTFPDTKKAVLRKILSNLSYIEKFFKNISLKEMGHYFGLDGSKALALAHCAIKAGVLAASINQMDQHVYFTTPVVNKSREMFTDMQDLVVKIKE